MKYIVLIFLSLQIVCYSQSDFSVQSISSGSKVEFPYVNGEGSSFETLNDNLFKYLTYSVYVQDCSSIQDCLDYASITVLDSLSYSSFQSDSTISFKFSIKRFTGDKYFYITDFMTFSKCTGERIMIKDILPKNCLSESINEMLDIQFLEFVKIGESIYNKYKTGSISKFEYTVIDYYLEHYQYTYSPYEFLFFDNQIVMQFGLHLPLELQHHIPSFIRIQYSDILSNIDCE